MNPDKQYRTKRLLLLYLLRQRARQSRACMEYPCTPRAITVKVESYQGVIFEQSPKSVKNNQQISSAPLSNFWRRLVNQSHLDKSSSSPRSTTLNRVRPSFVTGARFCLYPWLAPWRYYPLPTSLILAFFLLGGWGFYQLSEQIFHALPSPTQLREEPPHFASRITDRAGNTLYRIYREENRTPIKLNQLPTSLIQATIAIEDKNFYHHWGFDLKGLARAALSNLKGERLQGGSTITQQLVKYALLSQERTYQRKIKEAILAVETELEFSKDEILEMYFNQISYGGSTYGVEEAAQRYFGKSARALSLAESALLAGLPAAPSTYSPFGASSARARERQNEVLRRMVEDGYISETEASEASAEPLIYQPNAIEINAPHFVMYVRQLLAHEFGEELLALGGLEITTTLDPRIQKLAQETVTREVSKLKRLKISNGAALVTNPQTGEILAMVGSHDYFDFTHDGQVNLTLQERQPGSAIKPLTYALAFQSGLSPASTVLDAPITYQSQGSPPYSPRNYDGKFHGLVTLREALASSYNVPAVKTLASLGVENLITFAEKLGITTWQDRSRFGLSLTLGGGEVKMIELAQAYGIFANQGHFVPLNPILKVTAPDGELLYYNHCALNPDLCLTEAVLDASVAFQITDVLKDNLARQPAFGTMSSLSIPGQEVAVKTGTTNNLRDNWTFGYTSDRLVATWVGNNDNSPMSYVASGVTGASPIWNQIMRGLLSSTTPHVFPRPQTGELASDKQTYPLAKQQKQTRQDNTQ